MPCGLNSSLRAQGRPDASGRCGRGRYVWALACGGVAACLLLAGGLPAVQTAAVIADLPLSVVMLVMCCGI
ncbi:BCCT family transporter [Microvirga brassicacearum]|uniref:BCCT family transporter n=1 Tax=Microvirga brassicacearum TaxID=2580413 RepID=UPI003B845D19